MRAIGVCAHDQPDKGSACTAEEAPQAAQPVSLQHQIDRAAADTVGRGFLLELFRSAATTEIRRNLFTVVFDYLIKPDMMVRSTELAFTPASCVSSMSTRERPLADPALSDIAL